MTGRLVAVFALIGMLLVGWSSPASANGCSTQVGILGVNSECAWTYAEYQQSSSSGDGHTWVVSIQCGNGGICSEHVECVEGGAEGFVHDVYMDGTDVGDVCVPATEVEEENLAQLIIREFKRVQWPASKLVVQPRGGRTLVNFETNFYTPDHRAIDQTVTVSGQQVEIRAVPTTYVYVFGDGASETTASPGAPHPDLDITHQYERTGTVGVRVDTTYAGKYRIGSGDWVAIAETLTVTGATQDLEVVEALPQLVLH
ncbi:hypothetical protein F4692_000772 [Nocardioides cavernae]|uniref:PKD domain-containing protein n=1 Tax=Nocardioides cavernae TaxID=1921566 RepID=A0A7Y9KSC0_9ACTN|nr:hypothetical protein [Nocardioides cavernae]NYE35668.1 hypothetical protein [Nocardioides cavernae]